MKKMTRLLCKFFLFLSVSHSCIGNAVPRLLLFSAKPEILIATYEALGMKFMSHSFKGKSFFIGHNLPLCVAQSDPVIGTRSVIATFQKSIIENIQTDHLPNTPFGLARLDIGESLYQLVEQQSAGGFSFVFYVPSDTSIEESKDFFLKNVGPWQLEKHGNGPTHYAYENEGYVFELYPHRKKTPVDMDVLFPRNFVIPPFNDDEGRRFRNIP